MIRYVSLIVAITIIAMAAADAKKMTVTQRQYILMGQVNRAEKAGELTMKEAGSLRDDLAGIRDRESRMKNNNGGKLSYADITKIEKDLNKLSNKLHKHELSKRVD